MTYRKFLSRLIIFIIPLAAFLLFMELNVRRMDNSFALKKRNFEKGIDSVELVILGNSHSYYGVDPQYISIKSYNLANSSQSIYYDKEITLKYLEDLKNLKMVMISISYFSLYYRISDMAENWRDFFYYRYWKIRDPQLSYWDSRNYSYMMIYTPAKTLEFLNEGFKTNLNEGVESNGHFRMDTLGNKDVLNDEIGRMIVRSHTSMINFNQQENNVNDLSELIETLKKRGIKIILFSTPVASTYSKFCDSAILLRNNKLINQIVSKYSNCFYKDYSTDSRFTIKDFGNNDHLNFIGARKFSSILNDEYVIPYLNSKNNKVQN